MTFHLHIKGRVQGVGFRQHVYHCARERNINGYVSNEVDGVHLLFNLDLMNRAEAFAQEIIKRAPAKAIIQSWQLTEAKEQTFDTFSILIRTSEARPDLLISPDFALCAQCRQEFHDSRNRRFHYPFITCTVCGPRYSIINRLPYERHLTTMAGFTQCPECQSEYEDTSDRRFFSQTNSCSTCGILLTWHSLNHREALTVPDQILTAVLIALQEGKIVAIKGIGGFLLLCDAANPFAIRVLRERKHRPRKPFAVLFPNVEMIQELSFANPVAIQALEGETSPIVLVKANDQGKYLDINGIAPGLSTVGVMLPYAPLLEWISSSWNKPLIATSGNLTGSCIVFQSEKKESLFEFADFILDHNREILIPQDDSVIKFTEIDHQRVIIRRSRGLAPAIIPSSPIKQTEIVFAAGAMLKSAFAIHYNHQIYLSQYLGNLESYDSQQNYQHTFNHFLRLLNIQPEIVLADLHPEYPSTQIATAYSNKWNIPIEKIQHHQAHFAAVLGEHDLFDKSEKVLGVIWDGTGLGSDGNIWGSEFFLFEHGNITRLHYLEPFPNLAGDKMAREPRLSALAITRHLDQTDSILESRFTNQEWQFYQKAVGQQELLNSSAGRYFDGVASLLDLVHVNTYEGEAALILEQCANDYLKKTNFILSDHYFHDEIDRPMIPMKDLIRSMVNDIRSGKGKTEIAAQFHLSLAVIIEKVALKIGVNRIAFSGGVFQNSVLINMLHLLLAKNQELYFHSQMPPNDECIAFGQIMHHFHIKNK